MKTYTEQEVVELLKKFDSQFTHNVNSDQWYSNWVIQSQELPNIKIVNNAESGLPEVIRIKMIEKSELYDHSHIYHFGFYDGYMVNPRADQLMQTSNQGTEPERSVATEV